MIITYIDENSSYMDQIIKLGKINSSTLGFLPKEAYVQYARQKYIIVALNEQKKVVGYRITTKRSAL